MNGKTFIRFIIFCMVFQFLDTVVPGPAPCWAAGVRYDSGPQADKNIFPQDKGHGLIDAVLEKHNSDKSVQKEIIRKVEDLYREVVAAYKSGQYSYALDKMEVLEELLDPVLLPAEYCRKSTLKMNQIKDRMRIKYIKEFERGRVEKEERMMEQLMISSLPETSQVPLPDLKQGAAGNSRDIFAGIQEEKVLPVRPVNDVPSQDNENIPDTEVLDRAPITAKEILLPETQTVSITEMPETPRSGLAQVLEVKVEALYEDGVALYHKGVYPQAYRMLSAVSKAVPEYKMTEVYLQLIEPFIKAEENADAVQTSPPAAGPDKEVLVRHYLDAVEPRDTVRRDK